MSNIPSGAYFGTNPIESIVNAYCDPGRNGDLVYFYGGGHGDGTCNAVIEFNLQTLAYRLVGQPTPPSGYPPGYSAAFSGGPLDWTYPSGRFPLGFFLSSNELTDPADTPYANTLARVSTHMYAAAATRGTTTHYFYRMYGEFNAATGQWAGYGVDLGAQLYAYATKYGNNFLDQGTAAVYDATTDRFFVSMIDGGWRSGMIVFNPVTRQIESVHESGSFGFMNPSSCLVPVGRKLYIFNKVAAVYTDPQVMNQGLIFDMDTKTFKKFTISGSTSRSVYLDGTNQETIPCWYDGSKIHRWNYDSTNRAYVMTLDLTPTSGDGSAATPFVLPQTEALMGGTAPTPMYVYNRTIYHAASGCMLVLPVANSNWYALRMS